MIISKSIILIFTVYGVLEAVSRPENAILNQFCNNKNDCGSNSYICGNNKTCQCDSFFIPSKNGNKCVGTIGQMCKYDEHCIDGAFCEQQVMCKCKEYLYPSEDKLVCSNSTQITISRLAIFILFFSLINNQQ